MKPLIFEAYPGLAKLPWMELGEFPTPINKLENLGNDLGFRNLYVKRDDLSCRYYGGNKVRKLEWVLADAKAKERKTLLTIGGIGSNQVLATAIYGQKAGFKVVGLIFDQLNADYVRRNLLLDYKYNVEFVYASNIVLELFNFGLQYVVRYIKGEAPYYVPGGASSSIGNMGYVNAAFELRDQIKQGIFPEPDYILAAAGSLGTAPGLQLGCMLAGLKSRVIGVRVSMPWYITTKKYADRINELNRFMREIDTTVPLKKVVSGDLILLEDYLGKEYAAFTDGAQAMIKKVKELEGLMLDPTYTAKTLFGGLDWLKKQGEQDKTVLFLNTFNSVDLTDQFKDIKYQVLPRKLYKYFERPTQEEKAKLDFGDSQR